MLGSFCESRLILSHEGSLLKDDAYLAPGMILAKSMEDTQDLCLSDILCLLSLEFSRLCESALPSSSSLLLNGWKKSSLPLEKSHGCWTVRYYGFYLFPGGNPLKHPLLRFIIMNTIYLRKSL